MTTRTSDAAGVIVLDKPEGLTSHDVVARMRRVLRTRRVGHAGTLDPMATGVLVVAYGRGTRLLPYLQATTKAYRATVRIGFATTTDDRSGEPLGEPQPVALTQAALDRMLATFRGDIDQRPSAVSAVKVAGRRAHAMVRAGEDVQLPARPVSIHELVRIGDLRADDAGSVDVDLAVGCSTGTYVRALARDLGDLAGPGGHLTSLRRTAVGPFTLAQAHPLPAADEAPPATLTLGEAAAAVLPWVSLDPQARADAGHGRPFATPDGVPDGPVALLDERRDLVAVASDRDGRWHYRAVFV